MDKSNQQFTESYCKVDEHFTGDNVKLIGECLRFYADTQGNKDAVVFASDGVDPRQVVTYKELYEKALATGKSLIALGVNPGEIVALNIRPCPEWLFLTFGSILVGARVASISFTYTDGSDLIAMTERLQTCALLALDPGVDGNNWDIVQKMVESFNQKDGKTSSKNMPYLRYLIGHDFPKNVKIKSVQCLLNEENHGIELSTYNEDDIVVLLQTSGSTGVPKFVAHTHRSLLSIRKGQTLTLNKENIYYNDRPFNWIGGFPFTVFLGQTRVMLSYVGQFTDGHLQRVMDVISEEGCTIAFVLPPMLDAMIRAQDKLPLHWPLQCVITGGQPLTKQLSQSIGGVCKTLLGAYATTEFILMTERYVTDRHNFIEFDCGRLIRGTGIEMKFVDKNGEIVPVNTQGELFVKSTSMFKGYYNDPVKTAAVFDGLGWYKTDDLGRMSESGEIFIDGRKSNMILSGGMNVAPEIMEHVINSFAGIKAVVIVPVPDDVYYQVLCACVMVKKGSMMTKKDLRKRCEELHTDKPGLFTVLPKFYLFVDVFPQTGTGKTSRKDLEELAKQTFAHADN